MTVRPWQPGDETGIVAVVKAVYDEYGFIWDEHGYHSDLYNIAGQFSGPNRFWVATSEESVTGTAGVEFFEPHPHGTAATTEVDGVPRVAGADCEIVRLYVLASARGRGVGRALFESAVSYAKSVGRARMEIWSDVVFKEAHGLYQSFGARVVAHRKCDYPEAYEEYGLVLDL